MAPLHSRPATCGCNWSGAISWRWRRLSHARNCERDRGEDDTAARASHRSVTRVEQDLAERTVERRPGRPPDGGDPRARAVSSAGTARANPGDTPRVLAVELEFPNGAPARRARRRHPSQVVLQCTALR